MSSPWNAVITANTPSRGSGTQADLNFLAKTLQISKSWGSSPGSAVITYVGTEAPVTSGAAMTIAVGGHVFWGLCVLDTAVDGVAGRTRTLEFRDNREFLDYDKVFGSFNQLDIRTVNGERVRRYKHLYPADYLANLWTYTDTALTAAQIMNAFFNAPTVFTSWAATYHVDQLNQPVFDVDCSGGRSLGSVLQEISDRQGLVFTIHNGPFKLIWTRKGVGVLPAFPVNSDDRKLGLALSGNPTRILVVGERNVYQLMNVPLTKDWAEGWESLLSFDAYADDVFQRATDPQTGVRFNAFAGDPENIVGRMKANAYANTITVRQYAALRGASSGLFADYRKFNGRSRMDIPAALYMRSLVFRAFRPDLEGFTNADGNFVSMADVTIVDRLLTRVTHDPLTGLQTAVTNEPADGNGYAIVKNYQVGRDAFRSLRADQFDAAWFSSAKSFWSATPFHLDDAGDGERFLVFDEPVFTSENLLKKVDGQAVLNADYVLDTPQAWATLCVEAERFIYSQGVVERDHVENVGGLRGEFIETGAAVTELPFSDGLLASGKAGAIADSLLGQQFYYYGGGYNVKGSNATPLTSMIDRVSVSLSAGGGLQEQVDFTNERGASAFTPERDLDRQTREDSLLPGEAQLRQEANTFSLLAKAFRQSPDVVKGLREFLSGGIAGGVGTASKETAMLKPGQAGKIPVGTPLRKKTVTVPTDTSLPNTDTTAVLPASATSEHRIFAGVTVRDNEPATGTVRVQIAGTVLARVKGPVSMNDPVGLGAATENYFVSGGSPAVGLVQGKITDTSVKLIEVRMGAGGGAGGLPVWLP